MFWKSDNYYFYLFFSGDNAHLHKHENRPDVRKQLIREKRSDIAPGDFIHTLCQCINLAFMPEFKFETSHY
jgi:hypothetical protein